MGPIEPPFEISDEEIIKWIEKHAEKLNFKEVEPEVDEDDTTILRSFENEHYGIVNLYKDSLDLWCVHFVNYNTGMSGNDGAWEWTNKKAWIRNLTLRYSIPFFENGEPTEHTLDGVVGDERYHELMKYSPDGESLPDKVNVNLKK